MTVFRDLAEFNMGMNVPLPALSREEFEARKADLRRKRENERRVERYKWNFGDNVNSLICLFEIFARVSTYLQVKHYIRHYRMGSVSLLDFV
jgi:hypothetical protein